MKVRIESTGVCLPKKGIFIKGSVSHAVSAGKDCFKSSSYTPTEVGILINSGVFRDKHTGEPAMAAFIQNELKINPDFHGRKSFAFDLLNSGCGMLNSLQVITNMIQSGTSRIGMAVSSEFNPDPNPDPNYNYLSSGSAVLLDVSPDPDIGFGSFHFETFEKYADLYTAYIDLKEKNGKLFIRQEAGLHDAYLSCAPVVVKKQLKAEKLKLEDIDLIIPSQISADFISQLGNALDVPANKMLDITDILKGDTYTTSVFLALNHAIENKILSENQKVLFLTFGSGITVGSSVYYY
ncbi:MAG: hypothetical protein GY754_31220 [bacterium]|nr:hypothetical protein [bacterium]